MENTRAFAGINISEDDFQVSLKQRLQDRVVIIIVFL